MVQSIKNLIASVLIAISGFLLWTQILPKYELSNDYNDLIASKQGVLELRTDILSNIKTLNDQYNSHYAELQRLALVIPEKKSIPEVISMIEAMFSESGTSLQEYTLGSPLPKEGDVLNQISLDITGGGSYESLLTLLNIIEKNIRLFDITSLSIEADTGTDSEGLLVFRIRGQVYWLKQAEDKSSLTRPQVNLEELNQ